MTKFAVFRDNKEIPVQAPDDVKRFLAKGEKHWKRGRSAQELAYSWIGSKGIPPMVRKALQTCEALADAVLTRGYFEYEVDLRTRGRPSQTDLMAIVQTPRGDVILAIEGKVDETFGPLVEAWNDSPGKSARLSSLCVALELDPSTVGRLRYQLFHRTASALFEAENRGAIAAAMLVHSFDPADAGYGDFVGFCEALELPPPSPGSVAGPIIRHKTPLYLGWVRDKPR